MWLQKKYSLSGNSSLSKYTLVYLKLSKVWRGLFFLKIFLLGILTLSLTIEAKMALKSSLHIKYLSRNRKRHLFLVYHQVFLTLDGLFQIACPCSKLGIHPLHENGMKWFKFGNYMSHFLCSKCFCKICMQKVSTVEQFWFLESLRWLAWLKEICFFYGLILL